METRKRSDRWFRLNHALGDLDQYVLSRRVAGASWHDIVLDLAYDTRELTGITVPTVATLTRWYGSEPTKVVA